jgi:hypothetical protein
MPYTDPEKNKEATRRSRLTHSEKYRMYSCRKYRARLELIQRLKLGPCVDCGRHFHPVCMDFDHRPSEIKLFPVSDCGKRSIESIMTEIAKCDLVCSNCHRLRGWQRRRDDASVGSHS